MFIKNLLSIFHAAYLFGQLISCSGIDLQEAHVVGLCDIS